jgi:hypothetical protein
MNHRSDAVAFFGGLSGCRNPSEALPVCPAIDSVSVTSAIDGFFCPRQDGLGLEGAIPQGEACQT